MLASGIRSSYVHTFNAGTPLKAADAGSGQCYTNGQINLASTLSLWNEALNMLVEEMTSSAAPLDSVAQQTETLHHRHQKHVHAARELESDLRTGTVPVIGHAVCTRGCYWIPRLLGCSQHVCVTNIILSVVHILTGCYNTSCHTTEGLLLW
jgi:hypothetical protein